MEKKKAFARRTAQSSAGLSRIPWAALTLVLIWPHSGSAQIVTATDAMRKIKTTTNLATVPTSSAASISAPKNDFEAFQIVIQGPASHVSASASNLTGPGTSVLTPASCGVNGQIRLYQEAIINLTTATPSPTGGTGGYPDALIPNVDETDLQCRNAFPFDVATGQNRVIWVEVYVPPDRTAGTYTGTVTVSFTGGGVTIPVQLEVWDFPLPPQASLRSYFALSFGFSAQHPNEPCCDARLTTLRQKYSVLALDHRISTPNFDDGRSFTDISNGGLYDQAMGSLIDGTAATRNLGAFMTSMNLMHGFDLANATNWFDHFSPPNHNWFSRLFMYAADEPGSDAPFRTAWGDIAPNCDHAHAASPDFKTLVVSTFARVNNPSITENPPSPAIQVGFLPPKINVLVPNVTQLEDPAGNTRSQYDAWLQTRPGFNEAWEYISCSSYGCGGGSNLNWPTYVIDASPIQARALEWISFKNNLSGELYFDTALAYSPGTNDPWTNQFASGGNGDGTLFYPGTPTKVGPTGGSDIPIASLRMKMIREGMEDYELLNLLANQGDRTFAMAQVNALFPSGSQVDKDPQALYDTRKQLACRILQNMGKPNPCGPATPTLVVNANSGLGTGTITSNPAGIDCGSGGTACQLSFPAGTSVTLTATGDAGSTFRNYSGDCTGSTCVLTMNVSKSVTATFAKPCGGSDCFDRPDGANLGTSWNTYAPALQIVNGQATNTDAGGKESQWLASVGADQQVDVDCKVMSSGTNCGLMGRWSDANDYYYTYVDSGLGSVDLWRNQAGTTSRIASVARVIATNQYYHLRLVIQGTALTVYFNGETTPTISATDAALSTGNFGGLHGYGGSAGQSIWYAAFNIQAASAPPPPVSDFSVGVNPASVTAAQGSSATYAVSTAVTSGAPQTVTFATTGLPAGATASFSPASVTAGAGSTLTVSVASSTATGTYPFNIVGTGSSTTHLVPATLVVTTCTATECFDRANSASLGASWSTFAGAIAVSGNQATNTATNATNAAQYLTSIGPNQDVSVDCKVTGSGSNCGIVARWSDANDFYRTYLDGGLGAVDLFRVRGGIATKIGTAARAISFNTYYRLRLVVQGSQISVYFNNEASPTISASDSALTAGNFGGLHAFAGALNAVWWDNFTITAASGPTLLFADNFHRTTGLGADWTVAHGSYTTDGSNAVSGAPPIQGNWAKANRAWSTNNYSVEADIVIPAGSVDSGLLARSSVPGVFDSNLYAAQIWTDGNVYLFKRKDDGTGNFVWTQLGTTPAGIVANTIYHLKLVTTGTTTVHLEVWLNGSLKISFNDPNGFTGSDLGMMNFNATVKYTNFAVYAQ